MSTALLLWTVHTNLKVNDIIVRETLSDDRPLRSIFFISLRACKAEDTSSVEAMLFSVDFGAKCIYED